MESSFLISPTRQAKTAWTASRSIRKATCTFQRRGVCGGNVHFAFLIDLDAVQADQKGNLYVSAPGGLWVISPEGKHLGTIITPKHAHNFNWGDDDGRTLYLCARSGLYRIRLNIAGVRPN